MQPCAVMRPCAPDAEISIAHFSRSTPTAVLVVAQVFAVPASDLMRTTRGRAGVALARQIAMYLAHVVGGESLTDIGQHFRRDRTTVAHACRLVEQRRDDPNFDRVLQLLEWVLPVFANRGTTPSHVVA